MVPDWKALLPHRPLDPDSDQYVPPPTNGGERIAEWILADRTTVLVAGPVGIGKSTELARAAKLLEAERATFLIRLDRFENMKRVTVDQILLRIAGQIATIAITKLHLPLSTPLGAALVHSGVFTKAEFPFKSAELFEASYGTLLATTLSEVTNHSQRITLLIDGLEKLPDGPIIAEVFDALGMISDDVDMVAVLPWFLAFGAVHDTLLRPGEHLIALQAPEVGDVFSLLFGNSSSQEGRDFLLALLTKRLGSSVKDAAPPDRLPVFDSAVRASGGLPRTFLQLVADAGTYARMRRKDPWPTDDDLDDAIADQVDSFRRILRKGDTDAILAVAGQDGRELDLERKIRLLTHGILLERSRDGTSVLTVHPLVEPLLKSPGAPRA